VAELDPSGSSLVYSTYLGGSGEDQGNSIAVDYSGNAYVTGSSTSPDFPTTAGAYQTTSPGAGPHVFMTELDPSGAPVYSTYLGGTGNDWGQAIAEEGSGNSYVTGYTNSRDFPIAHALQTTYPGGTYHVFVTELDPNGATLVYSTYLGGSAEDQGHGIAV